MIKVSIIVPVYNVEKYLRKCLDSLVNQTLEEIEIIVVNDGSPDNSQDIIDDYVEKFPGKVIGLKKDNGGLSDARNYALPFCNGEYIGFVDSDDYVELDMYESMYLKAVSTDADLVMCDYYTVYSGYKKYTQAKKYDSNKEMFYNGLAAAWNKIYRRRLLIENNLVFPKGVNFEDTEFYCKLIPHIKVCEYVNKPFVNYIQRQGSIANDPNGDKLMHMIQIWKNIIDYYQKNNYFHMYHDEIEYFCARVLLGSHLMRVSRIKSLRERVHYAEKSYKFLNETFPDWKNNTYIALKTKRNIYMRNISLGKIKTLVIVLHHIQNIRDKIYMLRGNC